MTAAVAKLAAAILSTEKGRKAVGWIIVAILSPLILLIAFLCSLGSGAASHNVSVAELCFHGGDLPSTMPVEYQTYIAEMRASFTKLDTAIAGVEEMMEDNGSLDSERVKALFFSLYFGSDSLATQDCAAFVDSFVTYEERTRPVAVTDESGEAVLDENGDPVTAEETYKVAVPVSDLAVVYENLRTTTGMELPDDQLGNADSVYNLIHYGLPGGAGGSDFAGADVPYIGVNGFCSPIGEGWRSVVTSEFGLRRDPFTGESRGHTGIDLAVPQGTTVRAALPGKVIAASYNTQGYGYYVKIDHGNGLSTLYAHNSRLMVQVGQTVQAGDVVSLSGSTGRSTGHHLHFEVRVNNQQVNPRSYLP